MTQKRFHLLHLRKSEGFYGAERIILELGQFFQNASFYSWVGVLNDLREPCLALFEKAKERRIPTKLFLCRSSLDVGCLLDIIKTIKTLQIHLIHTHGFKADVYGWIAARCTGIPIISTQHGFTHKTRWIRVWESLSLYFVRKMDKVIGVSQEILETLKRHHIPSDRLDWIPNGVTVPKLFHGSSAQFQKEYGMDSKTKTIGIIGRLSVEKGHAFFLKALQRVHSQFPNLCAFVIGEGPLKESLKSQAHALGLDAVVHFLGFRSDMERVYPMLDIVVSSSIREGLPLTILEAMSYGKPVVATKVGGVASLIQNGMNGLLVEPRNEEALAHAILFLLTHPAHVRQMGKAARMFVQENYSVKKMCERYQRVYEALVSKKI